MDYSTLAPYFKYYDSLVSRWLAEKDLTCRCYLSEPWWGWSCNGKPLCAVVINLNPGEGGKLQSRECICCSLGKDFRYRESMANGTLAAHLPDTTRWHRNKRELPILKALGLVDERYGDKKAAISENTLCIEAYPFHSETFNDDVVKKHWQSNPNENFWQFIYFAATAAKQIGGDLKGIVLVRISWSRWERLTEEFKDEIVVNSEIAANEQSMDKNGGHAMEFSFSEKHKELQGVRFICIWSCGGRNNFPSDLKEIFQKSGIIKQLQY